MRLRMQVLERVSDMKRNSSMQPLPHKIEKKECLLSLKKENLSGEIYEIFIK